MTDERFREAYERLRRVAGGFLGDDGSLAPSDLLHEVYLKMRSGDWSNPTHFRRAAVRTMRSVVVDRARARQTWKRGGDRQRVTLSGIAEVQDPIDLIALHAALERLEEIDPQLGRIAELRIFGGLTLGEVAVDLGVSESTAKRGWRTARTWLLTELEEEDGLS